MDAHNTIKTGVIPAAGSGKRLGYLSNLLPKTLFPIYDRPILHHIINLMESAGVEDIYIIVNIHKEKIIEYCTSIEQDLKARISFIEQKELNGTANAILLLKKYIKNQPFLAMLGDEFITNDALKDFIEFFFANDGIAAEVIIREKDKNMLRQTCCARLGENNRILEITEKPVRPQYGLRGCGVYLFRQGIFDYIEKTTVNSSRREKDITTTIDNIAKDGRAFGFLLNSFHFNINNADELLRASRAAKKYFGTF